MWAERPTHSLRDPFEHACLVVRTSRMMAGNFCSPYGWAHLISEAPSVDSTQTHG
jgi:hypothetical protein